MSNIFLSSPLNPKDVEELHHVSDNTVIHVVDVTVNKISDIDQFMYLLNPYFIPSKIYRFLLGGYVDFAMFWVLCQSKCSIDFLDDTYTVFDIPSVIKRYKKIKSDEVGITRLYTTIVAYMEEMVGISKTNAYNLSLKPIQTPEEKRNMEVYNTIIECITRIFDDIRHNKKSFMTRNELQCCASVRKLLNTSPFPLYYTEH